MDINKLSKLLKIVAGVIGLIGIFFLVRVIMVGDDAIQNDVEQQGIVDLFVRFATILLVLVALITIILSVFNLIKQPAALKKSLLSIGILIVLFALTYFTASGDPVIDPLLGEAVEIKDSMGKVLTGDEAYSVSKRVSAMINFTGILGAAGLLIIGGGFVKNLIK